jgi:uncharacterized protein YbaP (TraB family)
MVRGTLVRKALCVLFLIVLVSVAAAGPLSAQEASECRKCSLWKVSSGRNTVYLLGSIHFLKKENYPLPAAMEKAFADASVVVFELDMDEAGGMNDLLARGMYPPGRTLKEAVGKDTYERLRQKSAELGADVRTLQNFRPWFVTFALLSLKLKALGFNPAYGIDRHFQNRAKKMNKEILVLETTGEQIDVFAGLTDRDQEALIQQTLDDMDTMDEELGRLVAAWRCGDGTALSVMMLKSYVDFPALYDRIMVRRNLKWMAAIDGYLRQGRNFLVVVGAGHLVGDDGLIGMLRKKGCKVEQL